MMVVTQVNEIAFDTVLSTQRILVNDVFVGTISFTFPNKTDCVVSGFTGTLVNLVRYKRFFYDYVRSTGRSTIYYTHIVRGREFKRVIKL